MEIWSIFLNIACLVAIFVFYLMIKRYLPSYFEEKGKNLATKQDVAEITRKTEEVQKEFKESFEEFSSDVKFKYDFYYKQYSELYCKLYAIIIQSEYVRRYLKLSTGMEYSFEDEPFIQMSPDHRETEKVTIKNNVGSTYEHKSEVIETDISRFNKKQLCDYIIENGSLASQELLKLAVSYRFAFGFSSSNEEAKGADTQDIANDEEFRLIKQIVVTVVKEYNNFRKELKLDYNEKELKTGIPTL